MKAMDSLDLDNVCNLPADAGRARDGFHIGDDERRVVVVALAIGEVVGSGAF